MNYTELQYISPGGEGRRTYMGLGYYPNNETRIVFDYLYYPVQGEEGRFSALLGASQDYFRFSSYIGGQYVLSYGNVQEMPTGFTASGAVEIGNYYIKVNGVTVYSGNTVGAFTSSLQLTLGADRDNGTDSLSDTNTKIGPFRIYEGNTLIADYVPALVGSTAGMYDKVSDTFLYCQQVPWAAGPEAMAIQISPTAKIVNSTGDSFTVNVETEDSWVANPADGSWYTITPTGGTGSSAVTITVPPYSGSTERTDTIDFVDTNTTDEVTFTLRQKKQSSGQPVYLGADEVTEVYLGGSAVTEAYLGTDLVYSRISYTPMQSVRAQNLGGTVVDWVSATTVVNPKSLDFKARITGKYVGNLGYYTQAYLFKALEQSLAYSSEFGSTTLGWTYDETNDPSVATITTTSGTAFDLTFGNNYIYDNLTDTLLASGTSVESLMTGNTGNVVIFFNVAELSRVQMWTDEVLVFDGKAAKRNPDNQGGLLDEITNRFYTDKNNTILSF